MLPSSFYLCFTRTSQNFQNWDCTGRGLSSLVTAQIIAPLTFSFGFIHMLFKVYFILFSCLFCLLTTFRSCFPSRAPLHPPRSSHEQHNNLSGSDSWASLPSHREPSACGTLAEERCPCGAGAEARLLPVHAVRLTSPHPKPGHYRHRLLPVHGHQHPGQRLHNGGPVRQVW